ncbi:hypothetical protein TNCV_1774331 [Trichonephila clavipes]|nr:hypothetical protein TNCV_1774331 [Trichonephila clavipes]
MPIKDVCPRVNQLPSKETLISTTETSVAASLLVSVVPTRISSHSSRHCWRSPLSQASTLIQRDFGCVLEVQQTKQLPHVVKVDLVWQLVV